MLGHESEEVDILRNIVDKIINDIYEFVKTIDVSEKVLVDESKVNYAILNNIPSEIEKINDYNPTMFMKAKKNPVELENIRNSHIKDGVAMVKIIY